MTVLGLSQGNEGTAVSEGETSFEKDAWRDHQRITVPEAFKKIDRKFLERQQGTRTCTGRLELIGGSATRSNWETKKAMSEGFSASGGRQDRKMISKGELRLCLFVGTGRKSGDPFETMREFGKKDSLGTKKSPSAFRTFFLSG